MNKLLAANFSRLRKDKVFWTATILMALSGSYTAFSMYLDKIRYGLEISFNEGLMTYVTLVGCCVAVFCSMFVGTEYSNGTIRNKLIVGHFRSSVYFSNWLVNIVAAMIMVCAFLLTYCIWGLFLLEPAQVSLEKMLFYILLSIFNIITHVSIFYAVSMLVSKRSVSSVLCILWFFVSLLLAALINARLEAPEFVPEYIMIVDGIEQMVNPQPNPMYLQPAARKIYQFFFDLLPSGQSIQITAFDVLQPFLVMAFSVALSIVASIIGLTGFRKKNLK